MFSNTCYSTFYYNGYYFFTICIPRRTFKITICHLPRATNRQSPLTIQLPGNIFPALPRRSRHSARRNILHRLLVRLFGLGRLRFFRFRSLASILRRCDLCRFRLAPKLRGQHVGWQNTQAHGQRQHERDPSFSLFHAFLLLSLL